MLAIITLGLMARALTYRSPLFDFHSWRQSDTAAIARNFLEERFNPLYPQIDQRGGRREGYVETGLELHAFLVASVAMLTGFSTELGRLLNTLVFPFSGYLLFGFIRQRYGERAGLVGLFLYALGFPLVVYIDRAFMNEPILLFLTIACLRAAQEYCRRPRWVPLAGLFIASSLIAIVKPTYLGVWAPVAGLFVERFGRAGLLRWEVLLGCAINLTLGIAWFAHARTLFETTGLTFGISDKLFSTTELLSPDYPRIVFRRLAKDILGPVGLLFGAYGLVVAVRQRRYAELLGVLAFVAYLVAVSPGNFHHNYYQLPLVPVAATLAALGITTAVQRVGETRAWSDSQRVIAVAAVLWVAAMTTFVRSVSAHNWYEIDYSRLRICEELKAVLPPGARVGFVDYGSPDILFCTARKGWLLDADVSPRRLRELRAEGAFAIVVERRNDAAVRQLESVVPPLVHTREFVAFRLDSFN